MRLDEYYTISEFLQLNEESTSTKQEFIPVIGKEAKKGRKDNEKAVKDILKNAMDFDKKGRSKDDSKKEEPNNPDYNRTNLEWFYTTSSDGVDNVPDSYKERVKKLATVGTESDMADYYDTKGNEKFYKDREKVFKNRVKDKELDAKSGLKGKEYDKAGYDFKPKTAYVNENNGFSITPMNAGANKVQQFTHDTAKPGDEGDINFDGGVEDSKEQRHTTNESKPMKRLKFKNTIFLSESQVLARVPEDYKLDENKFYMQDKTGTDYLVECKADPFGHIHMTIENRLNKQSINEELSKMKMLAGYSYRDDNVKVDKTKLEDMSESIGNFRKLLK